MPYLIGALLCCAYMIADALQEFLGRVILLLGVTSEPETLSLSCDNNEPICRFCSLL